MLYSTESWCYYEININFNDLLKEAKGFPTTLCELLMYKKIYYEMKQRMENNRKKSMKSKVGSLKKIKLKF